MELEATIAKFATVQIEWLSQKNATTTKWTGNTHDEKNNVQKMHVNKGKVQEQHAKIACCRLGAVCKFCTYCGVEDSGKIESELYIWL